VGVGGAGRDGCRLDARGRRVAGQHDAGGHARRPPPGGVVARRLRVRAARRDGPADRWVRCCPTLASALGRAVDARFGRGTRRCAVGAAPPGARGVLAGDCWARRSWGRARCSSVTSAGSSAGDRARRTFPVAGARERSPHARRGRPARRIMGVWGRGCGGGCWWCCASPRSPAGASCTTRSR
jgi:hypothetical protein